MEPTVVILARDCERTIQRAIDSALGLSSRVLVIDTGSTDRTAHIACENSGVQIHETTWLDSFAVARNIAFDLVDDGILFHLDSDEWIEADELPNARRVLNSLAGGDSCWSPIIKDVDDSKSAALGVPRIVSAQTNLRFKYRVHERLCSSQGEVWPERAQIVVRHDGYTKENVARFNKESRNLRLLRMSLNEWPGDPHLLFFWLRDGLGARSIDENRSLLAEIDEACNRNAPENGRNLRMLARKVILVHEWFQRGANPETIELAEQILAFDVNDPDAAYVIGVFDLLDSHWRVQQSMVRMARARREIDDELAWCMSGTPVHMDALIGEHLRTLGDARYDTYISQTPPTWNDPYFENSMRRGGE